MKNRKHRLFALTDLCVENPRNTKVLLAVFFVKPHRPWQKSGTFSIFKQALGSVQEYLDFAKDINSDPSFHIPINRPGAAFDPEQQQMSLTREPVWEGEPQAGLYCPKYREGYTAIHSTDVYWTAERVLDAPERFRVILAVDTGEVVGYIDITTNYDENEPFDVFVKESHRRKGWARQSR